MKFDYQTKLIMIGKNNLVAFYKYNNKIGFIPAEINFIYRGKTYNTSNIMTLLSSLYKKNLIGKVSRQFTINDWYINNLFNKKKFIDFNKELNVLFNSLQVNM
jgi:hypothetical protein